MRVALLLTLALLAAGVPQQRGGRRGPRRPPRGFGGVMAVRAKAEDTPEWVTCERGAAEASTARHVVTARVEQVGALTSHLQIKRVLKGDALPTRLVVSTCNHTCCTLRRRDTRVFLLGEPDTVEGDVVFPQVSPPLTLTLKTLALVSSAATDVPYEPRPPIQEEPCEQQFCDWGGECVTDEKGVTSCACPTTCPPPSSTTSPVCGTDGTTYPTICELRRHACRQQQNIRIRHSGTCDEEAGPLEEDLETQGRDRTPARDRTNTTSTPDLD